MIEFRKRLPKDPYFILSACGLLLMAAPLALVFTFDNLIALSFLPNPNLELTEAGRHFRSFVSAVNQCDPFMIGIGMILPAFGFVIVVIAWSLMIRSRFLRKHCK